MSIPPGTFVRLKSDPDRAGVLEQGEKRISGSRFAPVRFPNGQIEWLPLSALEPVPSASESPSDLFAAGQFVGPNWLRRKLTQLRVTGRLSDVVYSMEATETDFYAYQFKPVIKMMNSPTDALLIADEVGLGKTIEAGLVWTELRARLDCDRLLVICPKTLCQKWQDELDRRFGIKAEIAGPQELLRALKRNGEGKRKAYSLVCSMGLRPPRHWNHDESQTEGGYGSTRRELARFLDEASDGEPLIDLLVVDEAHHMRNPETLLNDFGKLANSVASHRLFLSATPIHLQNRDLHSILTMVDPDTFEFENTLHELIETNAPIIAARDRLLQGASPAEVLEMLAEAQGHEILRESKALAQLREELARTNGVDFDRTKRSELAARLEQVNQLANYVTRTRARDVQTAKVIREPKDPVLEMSDAERFFYDEISAVVRDYALDRDVNAPFLLATPQRLLSSSPAAASAYWAGMPGDDENEELDYDMSDHSDEERPLTAQIAEKTRSLDMTGQLTEADTKYRLLIAELRQHWRAEAAAKIIVFSSFKSTLHYLRDRLRMDGIKTELLHGSVKGPRAEILARFREKHDIRVLLSSEVGSEGVDLQFSSIVVNYDLPWNPMRLEQRIGRVDRLGQQKDKVTILNLIYGDTIDKRIYERLFKRLQTARIALGELESVLGEPIRQMTAKLLDPRLTVEQKDQAIAQTAQALENQEQEQSRLESEAGSLVQHGDYIIERIAESRDRQRWLSAEDILIYMRDSILTNFPGSVIESSPTGSDTYRIQLSSKGTLEFNRFLQDRRLRGTTRISSGDMRQRFRFTPSVVQKDRSVESISHLHPLVRFATELDRRDDTVRDARAVAAKIQLKDVDGLKDECASGLYVLAAHRWIIGSAGHRTANVRIGYTGACILTGTLIEADLAERMMAAAAAHGYPVPNAGSHSGLAKASTTLKTVVEPELDRRFEEFIRQTQDATEDRFAIRSQALTRHFEKKIDSLEQTRSELNDDASRAKNEGKAQRAAQLSNLAIARETRIEKLKMTWRSKEEEMSNARKTVPDRSDVGCLLLQVEE